MFSDMNNPKTVQDKKNTFALVLKAKWRTSTETKQERQILGVWMGVPKITS